jgi:hypothetical protein
LLADSVRFGTHLLDSVDERRLQQRPPAAEMAVQCRRTDPGLPGDLFKVGDDGVVSRPSR